ncbi:MAG: hypothetical protein AVDCRST_MAG74-754 [uncultured Pyrinomonadaceae bacterium]|uniref:Uncharacterized protein n=1 Tax=uncultured Pyrinomonadaceae bacterium TaxID=2283094 RepID=A0A6J4NGJ7_9BACT|nr:MAG: hypothetical protein AVDCRST_MAG74-754 [uncultured Pyrinomonadaceae bacterium]
METAVAYRYTTTNKEILSGEPIIKGTRIMKLSLPSSVRRMKLPNGC